MNKVLLKTSGRTGSHLILDYFESIGFKSMFTATDETDKLYQYGLTELVLPLDKTIVQCHLKNIPKETKEWNLIYNKRHDIVCQTLSSIIARHTNVWHGVANVVPFTVSEKTVKKELVTHIAFNYYMDLVCNTVPWKSVHILEMEDFITNPSNLPKLLNLGNTYKDTWDHVKHKKAIKYIDAISNYEETVIMITDNISKVSKLAEAYGLVNFDMTFGEKYGI